MDFSGFVGQQRAKLALILNAIDPNCGGVLLVGARGCGKSTLARLFRRLLPSATPFVELPLNATEEAILGGIDMEEAIRTGKRRYQPGVLSRAHGGFVYVDDVNLLSGEILAQVIHVQGRGENLVEREGLTLSHDADFQLVASMNPGDTPLSPHFLDRFGMAVAFDRLDDPALRIAVVRAALGELASAVADRDDDALRDDIRNARARLPRSTVSPEADRYIAEKCVESLAAGHRGDLFLRTAARAFAVLQGKVEVGQSDVDAVLPLVLDHRRRMEQPRQLDQPPPETPQQQQEQPQEDETPPQDGPDHSSENSRPDSPDASAPKPRESLPTEQVFDVGDAFPIRRLHFDRDRVKRGSSGRKVKTLSRDKRGRYVKSVSQGPLRDIAIDATIRAAAPLQLARGGGSTLKIRTEDFRFKQREKKVGHLSVFVVDGSGSMGAQRRMIAAKGAIESLLVDSYQKRDKVAMIVFRKDTAELVLPPTSSVPLASRLLRKIPVGGKTPLSSGLWLAHELVRRIMLRESETRFLIALITDGRANHSMTEAKPADEVKSIASLIRDLPFTESIVIDTENKSSLVRTDSSRRVAADLGGDYFSIEELRSENLTAIVTARQGSPRRPSLSASN